MSYNWHGQSCWLLYDLNTKLWPKGIWSDFTLLTKLGEHLSRCEALRGIVSTVQGLVERCCLLCSQAEGSGRRPSSLNFYFQRLPWKLGHCLRRGQRRFWREQLWTKAAAKESVNWLLGPEWGALAARKLLPSEFLQISFWLPRPGLRCWPFSPNLLHCVLMMIQLAVM